MKKSAGRDEPFISEALEQLITDHGDAPWLYDAYQTKDDAGTRLQIEVIDELYTDDVLPRKIKNSYIVVLRVKGVVGKKHALTTPSDTKEAAKA